MLISDLAFSDMEHQADDFMERCRRAVRRLFGVAPVAQPLIPSAPPPASTHRLRMLPTPTNTSSDSRTSTAMPNPGEGERFRWQRHPQLRNPERDCSSLDLTERRRAAQAAATRARFLARSGRLDEARQTFAQAAATTDIDLSATPGFWNLTRAGMLTAVLAYEDADRIRDAAALGARIRIRFRPTAITAMPTAEDMARVGRNRHAAGRR